MSATSIAQVCATTKNRVLDILKDIFVKIIDWAKQGENIILDVKIGILKVEKDNKLVFENNQDWNTAPNTDINGLNHTINVYKTEGNSRGPASVYSGCSNYSKLRSVKTPSTIGRTSVRSQARSNKWSFFKGSNPKENDAISRGSKNRSMKSESRRLADQNSKNIESLNKTSAVPNYPALQQFIKRHTEYRFGK